MRSLIHRAAVLLLLTTCLSTKAWSKPVQDQSAALRIAYRVLCEIYGKKQTDSELPLEAKLEGHAWYVCGHLPIGSVGGVAEIWINQKNGRVLKVRHMR